MASREWEDARRAISERPRNEWSDNSPLWVVDVDLCLLTNDVMLAGQVIRAALKRLESVDDPELALVLLQRRVTVEERTEDWASARRWAVEAMALGRTLRDDVSVFLCGVVILRIARRTEREDDPEVVKLRAELVELSARDAVINVLPDRPALMREAAAELGEYAPALLVIALERLGLELPAEDAHQALMTNEMLTILQLGSPTLQAAPSGSTRLTQPAGTMMAKRIRDGQMNRGMLKAITILYAESVDRLSKQTLS
jgi:hypothetical protein